MQKLHDDTEEITLVSILNEGLVPFKRIIPKNDDAFILEHRVLNEINKTQIVLFNTPGSESQYKIFIYDKINKTILKSIEYNNINNTWSYYNKLCKVLDRARHIIKNN